MVGQTLFQVGGLQRSAQQQIGLAGGGDHVVQRVVAHAHLVAVVVAADGHHQVGVVQQLAELAGDGQLGGLMGAQQPFFGVIGQIVQGELAGQTPETGKGHLAVPEVQLIVPQTVGIQGDHSIGKGLTQQQFGGAGQCLAAVVAAAAVLTEQDIHKVTSFQRNFFKRERAMPFS